MRDLPPEERLTLITNTQPQLLDRQQVAKHCQEGCTRMQNGVHDACKECIVAHIRNAADAYRVYKETH